MFKFSLILLLFSNFIYAYEVQYFIPNKFYERPFSVNLGAGQHNSYSPGKIFDNAMNSQKNKIDFLKKCDAKTQSKKIVRFTPNSFYNPQMNVFQTDLIVDFMDNNREIIKTEKITHKTVTRMADHKNVILKHYKQLIEKFIDNEKKSSSGSEETINGSICF